MANTSFLPTFGHPSTNLQGLKKQPNKSPPLNSTLKSFLHSLTPTRRTLVIIVILFNVFLVLYLTRTHILSPSESPLASPEFLPGESRIVRNISSQTYSGSGSLQNKGVLNISSQAYELHDSSPDYDAPDISSQTYGRLRNKGVVDIESQNHGSLANKGVVNISSETYGSLANKEVLNISSEANKGIVNISSESYGSLANKEVLNISSEANKGVENISSGPYGGLANKDGLNISSETFGGLPNKSCDSGRIYVYDLPPILNYDIKNNCTQLEPPDDKCDKLLNDGLGPVAKEYAGMFPESILPAFYWTDLYWGEVLFHNRMLNHRCRTLEPESATAFYIPFYAGLDVRKYLHNHTARERDRNPEILTKWVQEQKWWKRSNGSDHIIMLGRMTWDFRRLADTDADWGTRFLNMAAMQNVIRVTVERNVWDNLEVAVPYPTIFHPRSESDIIQWQNFLRSRRRNHLFTFVGGGRSKIKNDFRAVLKNKCLNESTACHHVDCSGNNCLDGKTAVMAAFLDSDFCLQPKGDGFTRRSVFDCMLAGSVPVFFWRGTAYLQYELYFTPNEPESYSVFIDHNDVRNGTDIRRVLEGYGREEVERMREKVIEYIPRFVYAKPSQGLEKTRDAFDIAIDGVLTKYKAHMERGRVGNWNDI